MPLAAIDYATCRHAPRPKGEQRARGCVLCEPRSALTRSAPVAPPRSKRTPIVSKNAPHKFGAGSGALFRLRKMWYGYRDTQKERPSGLRTPRIGVVREQARDSVFEKCSACSDTLRRSVRILLPICIKPGQRSRRIYSGTERERREAIFMSARTYSRPRP